jgi:hypothetical protein
MVFIYNWEIATCVETAVIVDKCNYVECVYTLLLFRKYDLMVGCTVALKPTENAKVRK